MKRRDDASPRRAIICFPILPKRKRQKASRTESEKEKKKESLQKVSCKCQREMLRFVCARNSLETNSLGISIVKSSNRSVYSTYRVPSLSSARPNCQSPWAPWLPPQPVDQPWKSIAVQGIWGRKSSGLPGRKSSFQSDSSSTDWWREIWLYGSTCQFGHWNWSQVVWRCTALTSAIGRSYFCLSCWKSSPQSPFWWPQLLCPFIWSPKRTWALLLSLESPSDCSPSLVRKI